MQRLFIQLFFIGFLMISCHKSTDEVKIKEDVLKSDLIESYIEKSKDKTTSIEERREYLDKAYTIYSTLVNNSFKIEKLLEISNEYLNVKDYNKYKSLSEKALKLSNVIQDSVNIAKSYFYLGAYHRTTAELDSTIKNFYNADKVYLSLDNKKYEPKDYAFDHGDVLLSLAQILRKIKDYSESESKTIAAIEKFEIVKNDNYLRLCYINLGIVCKHLERYEEAIGYYLKAIEIAKGTDIEIEQKVISYNNIGTTYKSQKKYDKAKEYFNKALSHNEYLKIDPRRRALLLDNLAYVNFLSKDMTNIPNLFYKALHIRDSIQHKYGLATSALHLGEYYQSIGKDSIAIGYAQQSRDLALEIHDNEDLLQAYQLLAKVSDYKTGLGYANKYITLNDSLIKEERLFRDKFARIKYETDEFKEQSIQVSKENQILIIAILGLTAMFLLGYIIFRQQQSNKELQFAQTQQESNEEIYRLLLNQQIKLEEGRQLEQQRMSEELHDGVLGRLFGVRLSLDGINQRANDEFTPSRNKYIEELKAIEKEIRLISHDLGSDTLPSDVAYMDAVETLIKDLCGIHKLNYEFSNDEKIDWEEIPDNKKVNFFRILQESMQNIFKHAQAENIKINFDYEDSNINLTILDDGIGFKSTKVKKGIGLKNITSRVSQMSGVVQFLSNQGAGTTVSVSVPV